MSVALEHCFLCGAANLRQVYVARDRHYGIPGLYRIVRCATCSLMFLNPMYTDQELSVLYPVDYYAYQDKFTSPRWKGIIKTLVGIRIGTMDPEFRVPGKMLDLGCGTGWFLQEMRHRGWEVYGVEINRAAAELGRKNAALNIFPGTLRQAKFAADTFDYIRANHSFEHISCPDDTLEEIYRVLRPGGKLLIGVPNVTGLNARLFRQYWWYLGAPVHPVTYSVKTLRMLLMKHDFEISKITCNSDYSGILGSLQIWLNRNNGRKSTEGALINSQVLKVVFQRAAKVVDLFGLGDAIEIIATKPELQS